MDDAEVLRLYAANSRTAYYGEPEKKGNGEPTEEHAGPSVNDDSLALGFIESHPGLRFIEARGQWMRWNGSRWEPDSTGHTFADVREYLRGIKTTSKLTRILRSAKTVAAVEKLSRYDRRAAATLNQWDPDEWLLNTPSGLIDLHTGITSPHRQDAYQTKLTAVAAGGSCPIWLSFLDRVTGGDAGLAAFLQRVAGYALTGSVREHALFFLYGTGGNGKGVYLGTLKGVFGDYAAVAPMETFTESFGDRHPTDLAALQGARLVIAQETEEGRRWAEAKLKALTGGDPITARFMRQDFFTYQPTFKLLIAGNHRPRLRSVDEAMKRRLHLIPFTTTIPPGERDLDLSGKLKCEWPGILQWALDGTRAYLTDGLNPPPIVRSATDAYFGTQDLFGQWLEDACETGPGFWETPTRIFASWKACDCTGARDWLRPTWAWAGGPGRS